MRACVVGAGAIGGWIAATLADAGVEVSLLARGDTLDVLREAGLCVGERSIPAAVSGVPSDLGQQDALFITVKAPALPALAPQLAPLIGPHTLIVPMLNGVPWWFTGTPLRSVDPHGAIAHALPLDRVIGCVVHASCRRIAPNHVEVVHADRLILGEPRGGDSDRVRSLCDIFARSGLRCDAEADIRRVIWYKLWGNATINPLSALTRSTADKLLGDPTLRSFMAEAMDELAAIGAAVGCPIAESAEDRMAVTARLGAFKSSMLQDVEAGRPIELEALVGAPLEIARDAAIPAPQLERIYAMTRLMAGNLALL
ncbi:2-dehydropantoate 2-reductase [Sphingomonas sabuli]|uniref:2-dehydropantoate 2-reductase n=1 Tax=Sphingomonas sabuli TaxID=2764186 RepID=A0A7G9L1D9_9SPHN|nr:2-dehydropantoate 2-reductase [Sphingomonas sabuli]QNM82438.1 2-dehydropantoate 2-reductase [Sphingomonas sabuli]